MQIATAAMTNTAIGMKATSDILWVGLGLATPTDAVLTVAGGKVIPDDKVWSLMELELTSDWGFWGIPTSELFWPELWGLLGELPVFEPVEDITLVLLAITSIVG